MYRLRRQVSEKHLGNPSLLPIFSVSKPSCQNADHPCEHVEQAHKERCLTKITLRNIYFTDFYQEMNSKHQLQRSWVSREEFAEI